MGKSTAHTSPADRAVSSETGQSLKRLQCLGRGGISAIGSIFLGAALSAPLRWKGRKMEVGTRMG